MNEGKWDDDAIRDLFRDLRAADRPRIEPFENLLARRPSASGPGGLSRHVAVGAVVAAAAVGVVVIGAWFFSREQRARDDGRHAGPPVAELDFRQMRRSVDDYAQLMAVTSWRSPTDSLLALQTPANPALDTSTGRNIHE